MSRTAQDVLEFDKLRELLRLRTTCAPGRRAVDALARGMERAVLESAFALIREAAEGLRAGREVGIRASMTETSETIQKSLKQILRARNAEAGEDYVTLRNDRFVIPVRAEHRRNIPGVVHGASATGQTVFMEPFETVEANNQLVQL